MGQDIEISTNGTKTNGYLAKPGGGSGPGVLVLQEWWGLVPHIRELCDRFAGEGFVALSPDLYHGRSATSPDEAGRLMMALEVDQAERDLAGAVRRLLAESSGSKVGVVGFCMGGQLALYAACKNPEIGACVDFYGIHPKVRPELSSLSCPVLGFFGKKDDFVNEAAAKKLEREIEDAGKKATFHVYPDVGHAFFNDSRPEAYDAKRAGEAWAETLAFFRKEL